MRRWNSLAFTRTSQGADPPNRREAKRIIDQGRQTALSSARFHLGKRKGLQAPITHLGGPQPVHQPFASVDVQRETQQPATRGCP